MLRSVRMIMIYSISWQMNIIAKERTKIHLRK